MEQPIPSLDTFIGWPNARVYKNQGTGNLVQQNYTIKVKQNSN